MILEKLQIEREGYGTNKGKLNATICIQNDKNRITMELPPDVGTKILQLAKQALIDAVEKSANDFIFDLTTAIPDTLSLESK